MSQVIFWMYADMLPMQVLEAKGPITQQPCMQNCFFFGFYRFDEAVQMMIVLVLATCRTSEQLKCFQVYLAG